jgi:tRNA threonylcarbamoyladenosine biosynthesis protein TsaE
VWTDESATQAFAQRLAGNPAITHATLSLHGDLGAGKTTLVRHLLRALGVEGRIKSPTYAVVEPHRAERCRALPDRGPLNIWHFDFYRFTDPREWEDAGFRELFAAPGLKLVEWPERAAGHLPPIDAEIHIQTESMPLTSPPSTSTSTTDLDDAEPVQRSVVVNAFTPRGQQLLAALRP